MTPKIIIENRIFFSEAGRPNNERIFAIFGDPLIVIFTISKCFTFKVYYCYYSTIVQYTILSLQKSSFVVSAIKRHGGNLPLKIAVRMTLCLKSWEAFIYLSLPHSKRSSQKMM